MKKVGNYSGVVTPSPSTMLPLLLLAWVAGAGATCGWADPATRRMKCDLRCSIIRTFYNRQPDSCRPAVRGKFYRWPGSHHTDTSLLSSSPN